MTNKGSQWLNLLSPTNLTLLRASPAMPDFGQISVKLPMLVAGLVALVSGTGWAVVTLTNLYRDVGDLKADRPKLWQAPHMLRWCNSAERINAQWTCPDPYEAIISYSDGSP